MEFRFLEIGDYDILVELWRLSGLEYKPNGRDSRDSISKELSKYPRNFIGLFNGSGVLIGSILATADGRKGWLNRVGVHPDYRGKGLAKALVKYAEEELHSRGIRIIAVLIYDWNKPSLSLARSMGYEPMENVLYLSKREDREV